MKLNNRGWGLREMLILSAVLIFFFCLAIYFIYLLYSSLELDLNNSDYVEVKQYEALEETIEKSAKEYLEDINQPLDIEIIIDAEDLINAGYMEDIIDPNSDNACDAYVKVNANSDIKAYIKCDEYITEGFEE